MADHRKAFRARRLAFGGRALPCVCALGAALALYAQLATVHAEEAGLKNGAASLAAGKYDAAVRQLSATVNSETAAPSDAARALYLRGIAYRKMGEQARAIADLGAAVWLGLPDADRVKAHVNRGLAYQAAGLNQQGQAEIDTARKIGGGRTVDDLIAEGGGAPASAAAIAAFSTEVRPEGSAPSATARASAEPLPSFNTTVSENEPPPAAPASPPTRTANASPGAWSTSVADASQPAPSSSSSGNRLTRWFGSLTTSDEPPAQAPAAAPASPAPAAAPPRPAAAQPPAASASSNWSTTTASEDAAASGSGGESKSRWSRLFNRTAEAEPTPPPAAAPAASSGGGYRLQLATSRSEDEAKALWKKVSQNDAVSGAQPEIERVDIGSFGTFYSLKIGPFPDKAESLKVCNALKRSGVDCSLATP
jgi:hypothetical protein